MAELHSMTSTQVSEAVQELDEVANMLGMPAGERCSILNLSRAAYRLWNQGDFNATTAAAPELLRRLNYALPLMRRMAANMPMIPAGRSQYRQPPAVN